MHESLGASRGLGFIWNQRKVTLNILSTNNNWISGLVTSLKLNLKFIIINIYSPTSNSKKNQVWEELSLFKKDHKDNLILLGGDFNTILNLNEKIEGTQ